MSTDTVDELHAAEDHAAELAGAIRRIEAAALEGGVEALGETIRAAVVAAAAWENHCRCDHDPDDFTDPEDYEDAVACCGCPCGHPDDTGALGVRCGDTACTAC